MAQDFCKTFGYGNDEKTTGTIDMDGVALSTIQALKMDNNMLKDLSKKLANRSDELELEMDEK